MIDLTDQGWVYKPATQPEPDSIADQEDAVSHVRTLQMGNRYIVGGTDSLSTDRSPSGYFVEDTRTGQKTLFGDSDTFALAATHLGIQPNLKPIYSIYSQYRFTCFYVAVGIVFVVPPLLDGTVFAVGASGYTAIYTQPTAMILTGSFAIGPQLPSGLNVEDGPAALLPSGNVLFGGSPGDTNPGLKYFEFNGSTLTSVPAPSRASKRCHRMSLHC